MLDRVLYGRINLEINLGPLLLPEIRQVFRPERSLQELAELCMVIGGVPQYLEMVDPKRSVRVGRLSFRAPLPTTQQTDR